MPFRINPIMAGCSSPCPAWSWLSSTDRSPSTTRGRHHHRPESGRYRHPCRRRRGDRHFHRGQQPERGPGRHHRGRPQHHEQVQRRPARQRGRRGHATDSSVSSVGAGQNSHALSVTGAGSSISAFDTTLSTIGDHSHGLKAESGAQVTLQGGSIETAGIGANGIDASGAGTLVKADGTTISSADTSWISTGVQVYRARASS